ncbi:hypothetical protein YC2023_011756 [Brassica napus]
MDRVGLFRSDSDTIEKNKTVIEKEKTRIQIIYLILNVPHNFSLRLVEMEKEIVLKQNVVPLFNCLICKKLFDHPTNITECNHIFCRRCIEDKFTGENLKACPVCNVDLGVDPLDKLKKEAQVRPNRSRRHLILIITSGLIPTTRTDQTSPHVFNRSNFSSSSRHYTDKENTREHGEVSYHLRSPSSDFTEHEASGPAQHLRT